MGSHLCGSKNNNNNGNNNSNLYSNNCTDNNDKNNKNISHKECHVIVKDLSSPSNNLSDLHKLCGDGKAKHLFVCKSTRCKLKNQFLARDRVVSSCTKRIYDCVTPSGSVYIDCNSANVIYLITCNNCGFQYVGETVQKLNKRFNQHRKGIKSPEKYGTCRILSNHFNEGLCKGESYTVQILEKLEGEGRTARGALDASITSKRKERELYWMMKLRTVFPYGLNDRIGDEFKNEDTHFAVGRRFPPLNRIRPRVSRGCLRKGKNSLTGSQFLDQLKDLLHGQLSEALYFIRIRVSSFKKKELKILADKVNQILTNSTDESKFIQWYSVVLDLIDTKLYKPKPVKVKKPVPSNICHVFFDNKGVEKINLPRILNDPSLSASIPLSANKFENPTVIYKLTHNIGSKIFNFNKFVSSLNIKDPEKDLSSLPCNCKDSPFIDKHHGHIMTGDLSIIKDSKLRELVSKGPKYREPRILDWSKARESINAGVKLCADTWCHKHKKNEVLLKDWVNSVMELVDQRITVLQSQDQKNKHSPTLKDPACVNSLQQLHSNYVITPIDKATGNVAVICKRFYAMVLFKELGICDASTTKTYKKFRTSIKTIINNQKKVLKNKFDLDVSTENECLPHIYWLPKMHKTPCKFRFIIAAPKCSIKPLNKVVTAILKLFFCQIQRYHQKSYFYSGVKTFWVVQNNEQILGNIRKLNKSCRAKRVSTFDFSTLYTNIPHKKLIDVLNELIEFCFKGREDKHIAVTKYGAKWVTDTSKYDLVFDMDKIKDALKYLMSSCFFTLGNLLFKQVIGIPMGSDPAPFMANLFLYFYENKWLTDLRKKDLPSARKFGNTFRFIDDLCAINDGGLFEKHYKDIYPPELELKKEHGDDRASFLDLHIKITEKQFQTCLFDKRDSFPFSIVRMPYRNSNIPSNMFYATLGSEVLRIGRATSHVDDFQKSTSSLLSRMKKQGAEHKSLSNVLKKMYGRHDVLHRFATNAKLFTKLFNV